MAALFSRAETDAFWVAFTLPNALRSLLGEGAASSAVVPVLAKVRAEEGDDAARRFFAAMRGVSLAGLVVDDRARHRGGAVARRALRGRHARAPRRLRAHGAAHAVGISRTSSSWAPRRSAWRPSTATGASRRRRLRPGSSTSRSSPPACSCRLAFVAAGHDRILALAVGVLVGGVLQVVAQWPSLRRIGFASWPTFHLRDRRVLDALGRMVPMMAGIGIYAIDLMLSRRFLSELPEGSQSYFSWAMRLCDFPQGIFVLALQAATLPSLAKLVAADSSTRSPRPTPTACGFRSSSRCPRRRFSSRLARPLVVTLFERGAFDAVASTETAHALVAQGLGVWTVAAVRQIAARISMRSATRARRSSFRPSILAASWCRRWCCARPSATPGSAWPSRLRAPCRCCCCGSGSRRRLPSLRLGEIGASAARTALASVVAGGRGLLTAELLAGRRAGGALARALPGIAGAVVFGTRFPRRRLRRKKHRAAQPGARRFARGSGDETGDRHRRGLVHGGRRGPRPTASPGARRDRVCGAFQRRQIEPAQHADRAQTTWCASARRPARRGSSIFFMSAPPMGSRLVLVDLPGYGFAKRGQARKVAMGSAHRGLPLHARHAAGRRSPGGRRRGARERGTRARRLRREHAYQAQRAPRFPIIIVATKTDKMPRAQRKPALERLSADLGCSRARFFAGNRGGQGRALASCADTSWSPAPVATGADRPRICRASRRHGLIEPCPARVLSPAPRPGFDRDPRRSRRRRQKSAAAEVRRARLARFGVDGEQGSGGRPRMRPAAERDRTPRSRRFRVSAFARRQEPHLRRAHAKSSASMSGARTACSSTSSTTRACRCATTATRSSPRTLRRRSGAHGCSRRGPTCELLIDLRQAASATQKIVAGENGGARLEVDFPAGDYPPAPGLFEPQAAKGHARDVEEPERQRLVLMLPAAQRPRGSAAPSERRQCAPDVVAGRCAAAGTERCSVEHAAPALAFFAGACAKLRPRESTRAGASRRRWCDLGIGVRSGAMLALYHPCLGAREQGSAFAATQFRDARALVSRPIKSRATCACASSRCAAMSSSRTSAFV